MKRPLCLIFPAVLAAVLLFLHLFSFWRADPYAGLDGSDLTISGRVIRKEPSGHFDIIPENGTETIRIYPEDAGHMPVIGSFVHVKGRALSLPKPTNPGMFDGLVYYRTQGIDYCLYAKEVEVMGGTKDRLWEGLFLLRVRLSHILHQFLPEESAGIMRAMLLGDKSALSDDTKALYRQNGIIHILTISGLHMSILGDALYRLLIRLRLKRAVAGMIAVPLMIGYGLLCGMGLSAARALVMFALRLIAERIGRSYDMLSAMSLAGLMLLLGQPLYALNSGFLFSFGALGALGFAPKAPEGKGAGKKLLRVLIPGSAVMLVTLPVYLCFSYTFPVYAVFLNLLVIPLTALLLPLGIVLLLSGLAASLCFPAVFAFLCNVLSFPIRMILCVYEMLCKGAAQLPFATWYAGKPKIIQVLLYLLLLVFACCMLNGKRFRHMKRNTKLAAAFVSVCAALVVISFRETPSLQITCVDVGQGDGIVVRHARYNLLIDGGSSSVNGVGTYRLIPYLKTEGIGYLDAVFVSHEDADHVNGISELLEQAGRGGIGIGTLFLPETQRSASLKQAMTKHLSKDQIRAAEEAAVKAGDWYALLAWQAKRQHVTVSFLHTGESFSCGALTFTCLGPEVNGRAYLSENANAHSMILHLQYGAFTALFTGDAEKEGMEELCGVLSALPDAKRGTDLLKVAHHGSRFTTDETFLKICAPKIALISCGQNNRYGHPHEELLERLKTAGARVFSTAESGALTIRVSKNGKRVTAETFLP